MTRKLHRWILPDLYKTNTSTSEVIPRKIVKKHFQSLFIKILSPDNQNQMRKEKEEETAKGQFLWWTQMWKISVRIRYLQTEFNTLKRSYIMIKLYSFQEMMSIIQHINRIKENNYRSIQLMQKKPWHKLTSLHNKSPKESWTRRTRPQSN